MAEALRAASIIIRSSIKLSFDGRLVGCIMNTSSPRIWSMIFTKVSLSGNDSTNAFPIGSDNCLHIDSARAGCLLPVKIFKLSIFIISDSSKWTLKYLFQATTNMLKVNIKL